MSDEVEPLFRPPHPRTWRCKVCLDPIDWLPDPTDPPVTPWPTLERVDWTGRPADVTLCTRCTNLGCEITGEMYRGLAHEAVVSTWITVYGDGCESLTTHLVGDVATWSEIREIEEKEDGARHTLLGVFEARTWHAARARAQDLYEMWKEKKDEDVGKET